MVFINLFRDEALLHSVSDTKRLTPSVDDADACPITNKNTPALAVATLLPDSENVLIALCRQLVPQGSESQRHWNW